MRWPYITWGMLPHHHHFARPGKQWKYSWTPIKPHRVGEWYWIIVRGESLVEPRPRPPCWIFWLYTPSDRAMRIEWGLARHWPYQRMIDHARKLIEGLSA